MTEDFDVIKKTKNELAMELVNAFLEKMAVIGYNAKETAALIEGKTGEVDTNGNS